MLRSVSRQPPPALSAISTYTVAGGEVFCVRHTLEGILGSPLPDVCFLLACLPVRKGGLGIRDPALVLGPAFIASNVHPVNSQQIFSLLSTSVHLKKNQVYR